MVLVAGGPPLDFRATAGFKRDRGTPLGGHRGDRLGMVRGERGELSVRIERPESPAGGVAGTEAACGGFRIAFDGDRPLLRLIPGERRLASGMPDAVLRGLSDAPAPPPSALSLPPPPPRSPLPPSRSCPRRARTTASRSPSIPANTRRARR